MNTLILNKSDKLEIAAKILQNGGLVVSPTETVYGLCANALNEKAVESIFWAKGRPSDNPLIVHIASLDMLRDLVLEIPDDANKLINTFWPGPLTLIFKAKKDIIPNKTRANLDTVAIRFPANPIMLELIKISGLPLAAPSANTSGKPSPTNINRVIEDLSGKVDCIIDGGNSKIGIESTIIDVSDKRIKLLRPGFITLKMLEDTLKKTVYAPKNHFPIAPGMKYKHYAPNANLIIVDADSTQKVINRMHELIKEDMLENRKIGVLVVDEMLDFFENIPSLSLGSLQLLEDIASNLFEKLRQLDDLKLEKVYTIYLHDIGLAESIMNRLLKACNNQIIRLEDKK